MELKIFKYEIIAQIEIEDKFLLREHLEYFRKTIH